MECGILEEVEKLLHFMEYATIARTALSATRLYGIFNLQPCSLRDHPRNLSSIRFRYII